MWKFLRRTEPGAGNDNTQVFLPVWLQKSFGADKEWTTFGGGGIWFNRADDHRNFYRFGWELQRDLGKHLTLGGEIYHETSTEAGGHGHTAFNLGGYLNFDEHNHVLFSFGRDIDGETLRLLPCLSVNVLACRLAPKQIRPAVFFTVSSPELRSLSVRARPGDGDERDKQSQYGADEGRQHAMQSDNGAGRPITEKRITT